MDAQIVESALRRIFGNKPDDSWLLIWTLQNKTSHWYQDVDAAIEGALNLGDFDTYIGVGLSGRERGPQERCKQDEVIGIVGLWADIDYADEAHQKKAGLPPDEASARLVLDDCGIAPSLLVHSGHGLQGWWPFAEPWIFENDAERVEAMGLALRWNTTLQYRARKRLWLVDSVQDISRLMRLPGSVNRKVAQTPVPATVIFDTGATFNPSDFEDYIPDEAAITSISGRPTYVVTPGSIAVHADAAPSHDKLELLRDAAGLKFTKTWDRERTDLQDQSASSYDMALAHLAVQAGWSDQEITDLLIARRRRHGADLKLRIDYYENTISKARGDHHREESLVLLKSSGESTREAVDQGREELATHRRFESFDHLSNILEFTLVVVERIKGEPTKYRFITIVGTVTVDARDVPDYRKMKASFFSAADHVIPKFKGDQWDDIAQTIANVAVDIDTGDDSTKRGVMLAWLDDYLTDRNVTSDSEEAHREGVPYTDGDRMLISSTAFERWLRLERSVRLKNGELGEFATSIEGVAPGRVSFTKKDGGRSTLRGYWLPVGFTPNGGEVD